MQINKSDFSHNFYNIYFGPGMFIHYITAFLMVMPNMIINFTNLDILDTTFSPFLTCHIERIG